MVYHYDEIDDVTIDVSYLEKEIDLNFNVSEPKYYMVRVFGKKKLDESQTYPIYFEFKFYEEEEKSI